MGMGKRTNYNILLMNSVDYGDLGKLKRLLNQWLSLEKLADKGDQVAMSIMMDIKTCFGEYSKSPTLLTGKEIHLIRTILIDGYSQRELALEFGVTQKTISIRVNNGLEKMAKMLKEDGTDG